MKFNQSLQEKRQEILAIAIRQPQRVNYSPI